MTVPKRRGAAEPVDDHTLVSRFRSGDEEAFTALYERYNARLTSYAARLLGSREEGEEMSTEAFLRLVQGRVQPTGSFRAYVFTVVHRLCLDRLRWRGRRAKVLQLLGRVPPERPDLEGQAVLGERQQQLHRAIATLSIPHQAVVLLTYAEGMTSPEAAQVLGWTDQQVRSKLAYARRLLRAELEEVSHG
ncbi:MAG: sigma-70 family RNA polymerase sigma factor [Myxococcota bacterium]